LYFYYFLKIKKKLFFSTTDDTVCWLIRYIHIEINQHDKNLSKVWLKCIGLSIHHIMFHISTVHWSADNHWVRWAHGRLRWSSFFCAHWR